MTDRLYTPQITKLDEEEKHRRQKQIEALIRENIKPRSNLIYKLEKLSTNERK